MKILSDEKKITVKAEIGFSKRYLKYLTKKYLKKNSLREFLYVVAANRSSYQIKYFNIQQEGAEQEWMIKPIPWTFITSFYILLWTSPKAAGVVLCCKWSNRLVKYLSLSTPRQICWDDSSNLSTGSTGGIWRLIKSHSLRHANINSWRWQSIEICRSKRSGNWRRLKASSQVPIGHQRRKHWPPQWVGRITPAIRQKA